MLRLAQKIFLKAEECDDRSEAWLSQYLLGKTYEKLENGEPGKYLAQYASATECLHKDGAKYPTRIAYYKSPELALEAMEMFYRTFAAALKYLTRSADSAEEDLPALRDVEFYLGKAEVGYFAKQKEFDAEKEDNLAYTDG